MEYLIPVGIVVLVTGACYYFLTRTQTNLNVVPAVQDGKKEISNHGQIPLSNNQPKGIEFSYTCWIRIDDFTYRYGAQKVIFVKGNPSMTTACPALLIDANTNSLLVKMDTFGSQEIISVVSVPSRKWLHVAITVNQESLDVYINGIVYAHHTLTHLPRQNTGSLLTSPDGGFAGKIVSLEYYPKRLSNSDILTMASQSPPISSEKGTQVLPPYFSYSWFKS
jgi:hypothetical protein